MRRLALSVLATIPLLASCQSLPVTSPTQAEQEAAAIATSSAIARGQVGNAISGTVELPSSLRALSQLTDGAPPVTIHAFRTTGELIRAATVSVFWKDDQSVGYVVDDVPTDHAVVLAATIEPGLVLRAIVPKSSREHPTRGQTINTVSETVVLEAYLGGLIPPVGLGGMAEVLLQGGLDPAAASQAHAKAAEALSQFAATNWAQGISEATEAVSALQALATAQQKVAGAIAGAPSKARLDAAIAKEVFGANLTAKDKLSALKAKVEERSKQGEPSWDASDALKTAASFLQVAANSDVPHPTDVLASSGTFHIAQVPPGFNLKGPFPYKEPQPSKVNLSKMYQDYGYLAANETGFFGPNGGPFTEAEIEDAFEKGKGPYRTSCTQISFDNDRNCQVVTNPADKSHQVLITREADVLSKRIDELVAAVKANDEQKVKYALWNHPALLNFIADDKARWTSPAGTWRLRLLQDTSTSTWFSGPGWSVLNDAEMYIMPPNKDKASVAAPGEIASGTFIGVVSIWMPGGDDLEALSNFAIRFEWDAQDKTMLDGRLHGERVYTSNSREDYTAEFEGRMEDSNRILGYWFNDERGMSGRFEMIRGTATYTI